MANQQPKRKKGMYKELLKELAKKNARLKRGDEVTVVAADSIGRYLKEGWKRVS